MLQAVAAEVEQLQVFGHQELPGLQLSDAVPRQVHLHDVRREPGRDVVQVCEETKKTDGMTKIRRGFCKDPMRGNDETAKKEKRSLWCSLFRGLLKASEKVGIRSAAFQDAAWADASFSSWSRV